MSLTSVDSVREELFDYLNCTTGTTRSASTKLYPKTARTYPIKNSYFYCLPRLWNSLPIIELSQSLEIIEVQLKKFYGITSYSILAIPLVVFTTCVLVPVAIRLLHQLIITFYN